MPGMTHTRHAPSGSKSKTPDIRRQRGEASCSIRQAASEGHRGGSIHPAPFPPASAKLWPNEHRGAVRERTEEYCQQIAPVSCRTFVLGIALGSGGHYVSMSHGMIQLPNAERAHVHVHILSMEVFYYAKSKAWFLKYKVNSCRNPPDSNTVLIKQSAKLDKW